MSTTTFAGPVKAGDILNTTGTTLSENVANQGQATMVQVAAVTEAETDDPAWSGIVIPANSQITRMAVLITTAWNNPLHVGRKDTVASSTNYFVNTFPLAVGLQEATAQVNHEDIWRNTGALDIHLTYTGNDGGGDPGAGVLIVEYIQNNNLTV